MPSDTSSDIKELRFHLTELTWDLKELSAQTRTLRDYDGPDTAKHVRFGLATITAAVEHDAQHHAPRAHKLTQVLNGDVEQADPEFDDTPLNIDAEAIPPKIDGALELSTASANLTYLLDLLKEELERALVIAQRAYLRIDLSPPDFKTIAQDLKELAEILQERAQPHANKAGLWATAIHRASDPAVAEEEDLWREIATPLHERPNPEARQLTICPECGSSLSRDDRTFDGSYCEHCRTRWYEPPRE
jgi:hypothetical protein